MRAAALLAAAAIAVAGPAGGAAAETNQALRLLERATTAARTQAYAGEALAVVWGDGGPAVTTAVVRNEGGELVVETPDRWTMRLAGGGGLVDHAQGWHVPLPRVRPARSGADRDALTEKYEASVVRVDQLLDRDCPVVELRLRDGGDLRERLWIDDDSGLVLRRETYDASGDRVRLLTYLALDLTSARERNRPRAARGAELPVPLTHRPHEVKAVTAAQLTALRASGWTVPRELPGGYRPVGGYVVDTIESQPLHLLYRDGLYSVSLFQQRGGLDPDDLPGDAQPVPDLPWPAWQWPGALPHRLVWDAGGTTFSLVGDAPPDELRAIAAALPRPADGGALERLRRGLQRLWSWVAT